VIVATCGRHIETFYFRWGDDKSGEVVSVDIATTPIANLGGVLSALQGRAVNALENLISVIKEEINKQV